MTPPENSARQLSDPLGVKRCADCGKEFAFWVADAEPANCRLCREGSGGGLLNIHTGVIPEVEIFILTTSNNWEAQANIALEMRKVVAIIGPPFDLGKLETLTSRHQLLCSFLKPDQAVLWKPQPERLAVGNSAPSQVS
jgi:hypothetical protein